MKNRKLLALLACLLVVCFVLTGCKGKESDNQGPAELINGEQENPNEFADYTDPANTENPEGTENPDNDGNVNDVEPPEEEEPSNGEDAGTPETPEDGENEGAENTDPETLPVGDGPVYLMGYVSQYTKGNGSIFRPMLEGANELVIIDRNEELYTFHNGIRITTNDKQSALTLPTSGAASLASGTYNTWIVVDTAGKQDVSFYAWSKQDYTGIVVYGFKDDSDSPHFITSFGTTQGADFALNQNEVREFEFSLGDSGYTKVGFSINAIDDSEGFSEEAGGRPYEARIFDIVGK